ncbi:hypothetical protein W97_05328 [Coniosporium apollinis CBS 100218]|uniref:Transcription factor domain-containing protein n=1 Tax=Coniosporium apollinis (strain CBS 100218) TaxID=1168221 RepID=R7YW10_CONA1|nr:uncharacterized protein W97_05328 [Coniosporium apollinis CBS 100218]EON66085.1 hypothetical protein W97_05328 [Coniosporium apollinis CBS 100218]
MDCIYDVETSRSRHNTGSSDTTSRNRAASNSTDEAQSSTTSRTSQLPEFTPNPRRDSATASSVAVELEQMFQEIFSGDPTPKSNAYQEQLATFYRDYVRSTTNEADDDSRSETLAPSRPRYHNLFVVLVQDLLSMLTDKFGDLGCQHIQDGKAKFYVRGLAHDKAMHMFDLTPVPSDLLAEYESRRTTQMIDVWFSMHPLSMLISKTLLLQSLRNKTVDEILLAAIVGGAEFSRDDEASRTRTEALFRWAANKLRARSAADWDLSTAQALMLLGWHDLCYGSVRRATCYIGYAGRMVTALKTKPAGVGATANSRVNGISASEVEEELLTYSWWITFSVTLWTFMQMDRPFTHLLPSVLPPRFLPLDESSSVPISLDEISENLSTLPSQKRVVRDFWPLSHISFTTAHVYALQVEEPETEEESVSGCWQERTFHQFRHLPKLSNSQNIGNICANVRRVFSDAIVLLKQAVINPDTVAVVSTFAHTVLIHLLFPRSRSSPSATPASSLTEETMKSFFSSAEALLILFSETVESRQNGRGIAERSYLFELYISAMDACGRAMELFYISAQRGPEPITRMVTAQAVRLCDIATRMHAFARDEVALHAQSMRPVKKRLKAVRNRFQLVSQGNGVSFADPIFNFGAHPTFSPDNVSLPSYTTTSSYDCELFKTPSMNSHLQTPLMGSQISDSSNAQLEALTLTDHPINWSWPLDTSTSHVDFNNLDHLFPQITHRDEKDASNWMTAQPWETDRNVMHGGQAIPPTPASTNSSRFNDQPGTKRRRKNSREPATLFAFAGVNE